ncbi:hypothetical protein [Aeromicrobium sp. UC242_57]
MKLNHLIRTPAVVLALALGVAACGSSRRRRLDRVQGRLGRPAQG